MMYLIIVLWVIWTIITVIGTLLAEYLIGRNNKELALRKFAEALVVSNHLKSTISDVENTVNQAISLLK